MSRLDRQLARLLRAAAGAQRPREVSLPLGFEARVLAGWRASREELDIALVFRMLRGGLALTSMLMVLAVAATYFEVNRVSRDLWSMPNAVVWSASVQ
ncbi:MAG TPA: hypothetical protein PLW35_05335 [Verrucomicrobiota bacterium]|nr:hypothetical protein [Verrucomicrobiota bacterium]HOK77130.1 hypothetical protein [Verrucomicrobiota bacterium]